MKELKNNRDKITAALAEMLKHALYSRQCRLRGIGRGSLKTLLKVVFLNMALRKLPSSHPIFYCLHATLLRTELTL